MQWRAMNGRAIVGYKGKASWELSGPYQLLSQLTPIYSQHYPSIIPKMIPNLTSNYPQIIFKIILIYSRIIKNLIKHYFNFRPNCFPTYS